jgi:hypothetical protein
MARSGMGFNFKGESMQSQASIDQQPLSGLNDPGNGASGVIAFEQPYIARITIKGDADLLFHRWDVDAVEQKAKASKGSAAKKTDAVETFVYRDDDNYICLPGEYLRMAIAIAAKFKQDPRSPRKSAYDLFKAGVVSLTELARITTATGELTKEWDYIHRKRARVQLVTVTRHRPAFHEGWAATTEFLIATPDYIPPKLLHEVATLAGRLEGVGDFRPTYGRFQVTHFSVGFENESSDDEQPSRPTN